jgi:hypothetical protein
MLRLTRPKRKAQSMTRSPDDPTGTVLTPPVQATREVW